MKYFIATLLCVFALSAKAQLLDSLGGHPPEESADELDPTAPDVEQTLKAYDLQIQTESGQPAFEESRFSDLFEADTCYRLTCTVYARIIKSEQKMYLYINGRLDHTWDVSSGAPGHGTPDFDQHPNGRIYDNYTSKTFPGGNYKGLGNMPYAVFIKGGFAVHGTTEGNFSKLGQRASHGCIRLHPVNGKVFNRLVREHGIKDTWITVE